MKDLRNITIVMVMICVLLFIVSIPFGVAWGAYPEWYVYSLVVIIPIVIVSVKYVFKHLGIIKETNGNN